jgi:hypothetical protein
MQAPPREDEPGLAARERARSPDGCSSTLIFVLALTTMTSTLQFTDAFSRDGLCARWAGYGRGVARSFVIGFSALL